jgi:acyl-CoA dehydrogenase family member 9
MMSKGFLEDLYLGKIDWTESLRPPGPINHGKVNIILDRYKEILREHPTVELDRLGRAPPEVLRRMAEIGLFGLIIPVRYGGLGLNLHEYLWLVERMVALDFSVSLISLAHLSIGTKGLVLFGTDSQKDRYLIPAASGDTIFSYALTEPLVGSDAQHVQTRAALSEDGRYYILNGQKTYITNANYAGALTTFAQLDSAEPGTHAAFIVETGWEGVKIGKDMPKMGLESSSTAAVIFRNVHVPVTNMLGEPGQGFKIAMNILNFGRLGLGAASAGTMSRSLEDMLARSAARRQFGRPIQSFPLIQEKLVKTRVHQRISASLNSWVAQLLEEDPLAPLAVETSHCKLYGTVHGWQSVYDALQVAGGAGYLKTHPYEKRMRDFRVTTVFEGTTEIHSIYPAIHLLRKTARLMQGGRGGLGKVWRGVCGMLRPTRCRSASNDQDILRALKHCRKSVRSIRKLLFGGLMLYGSSIFERQFFLRRLSMLSLSCFAILSLVKRAENESPDGVLSGEDKAVLRYALEEAEELRKQNSRLWPSPLEKLHLEVMTHCLEIKTDLQGAGSKTS